MSPGASGRSLDPGLRAALRRGFFADGRWLAAGLLAAYGLILLLAGPADELAARWRRAGVYAYPASFMDLRVFPAAQATVAAGGDLYGQSVTDPLQRPYNYPRVWLAFMRYPATESWFRALGVLLGVAAVTAVLIFWGRLTLLEGVYGGALFCSPAFQLGLERGNTDLVVLVLVTTGVQLADRVATGRLTALLWWLAAVLKLFPVLVFGAWFGGSGRDWLRRVWLPLGLFAVYLVLIRRDLGPVLENTGGGWIQSYGSEVWVLAAGQAANFYGNLTGGVPPAGAGRLLALAGMGWMLFRGWRGGGGPRAAERHALPLANPARLGFRAGVLVYLGTFIAGSSFDYRQCFLLLTLPQLFAWRRAGDWVSALSLGALLFAFGSNYLLAGWWGFFINETAGWLLLLTLAYLLAGTWRSAGSPRS